MEPEVLLWCLGRSLWCPGRYSIAPKDGCSTVLPRKDSRVKVVHRI